MHMIMIARCWKFSLPASEKNKRSSAHSHGTLRWLHDLRIISGANQQQMFAMAAARKMNLPLFEIAFVFVRLDHVASIIENANHSIM